MFKMIAKMIKGEQLDQKKKAKIRKGRNRKISKKALVRYLVNQINKEEEMLKHKNSLN